MSEETTPTPETPADDLDTILDDQTTQETPPETPAEPETPPVEAPKAPETPVSPAAPAERQPTASELRLAELDAILDREDFDPFSKEGRAAHKEYAKVAAKVEAEPLRAQLHESTIWNNLADEHEIPAKTLKAEWAKVCKELPNKTNEVRDYEFERRVDAIKLSKTKTPADEPAEKAPEQKSPSQRRVPIQPSNGNVAPPVGTNKGNRPPTPGKTPEEAFDRSVTAEDLTSLV